MVSGRGNGQAGPLRVHRVAHELKIGPIPEGLHVLHDCDTPECFEPKHLYAGTQVQNVADMFRRGRSNRLKGTNNPNCKLTPADVYMIREVYGNPDRRLGELIVLARDLGVSSTTIGRIGKCIRWKHLQARRQS